MVKKTIIEESEEFHDSEQSTIIHTDLKNIPVKTPREVETVLIAMMDFIASGRGHVNIEKAPSRRNWLSCILNTCQKDEWTWKNETMVILSKKGDKNDIKT